MIIQESDYGSYRVHIEVCCGLYKDLSGSLGGMRVAGSPIQDRVEVGSGAVWVVE